VFEQFRVVPEHESDPQGRPQNLEKEGVDAKVVPDSPEVPNEAALEPQVAPGTVMVNRSV
jgi:hypothetical protein